MQSKRFYRHTHWDMTVPLSAKEVHPTGEHHQEYQGCVQVGDAQHSDGVRDIHEQQPVVCVESEGWPTRWTGNSLVFIFPLAPMLTFTSAVGKLNVRVLWHHHMLLQVISQRYCQVFVKSYNFVFEKIDKEGSPREKWPKQGHFCPRAMGILPPPKYPRVVKQPPTN